MMVLLSFAKFMGDDCSNGSFDGDGLRVVAATHLSLKKFVIVFMYIKYMRGVLLAYRQSTVYGDCGFNISLQIWCQWGCDFG